MTVCSHTGGRKVGRSEDGRATWNKQWNVEDSKKKNGMT